MVKFNTNEKKRLRYDISVSGVETRDLRGSLKLIIDNVEYGFPISIQDGDVIVEVPPMASVTSKELVDGMQIDTKLEIVANDTYLVPWTDKATIVNPLTVEAKLTDTEEVEETILPVINFKGLIEEIEKDGKVSESRIVIDVTSDAEMKIAKKLGEKYNKQLVGYTVGTDDVIFDGSKNDLDKIKKEFEKQTKHLMKKKSRLAERLK